MKGPRTMVGDYMPDETEEGYAKTNQSLGRPRSLSGTHEEEAEKPEPPVAEGLQFKEKMARDGDYYNY